jgi:hypothetical protein
LSAFRVETSHPRIDTVMTVLQSALGAEYAASTRTMQDANCQAENVIACTESLLPILRDDPLTVGTLAVD